MKILKGYLVLIFLGFIIIATVKPPLYETYYVALKANDCDDILKLNLSPNSNELNSVNFNAKINCLIKTNSFREAESLLQNPLYSKLVNKEYLHYLLSICYLKLDQKDKLFSETKLAIKEGISPIAYKNNHFKTLKNNIELNTILESGNRGFNGWVLIFLYFVIQSVLLSSLFLFKCKNHYGNNLLALLNVAFGITLLNYIAYWSGLVYHEWINFFSSIHIPISYVYGPLVYLYVSYILKGTKPIKLHFYFIPFYTTLAVILCYQSLDLSHNIIVSLKTILFNPITRIAYLLIFSLLMIKELKMAKNRSKRFLKYSNSIVLWFCCFTLSYISYYTLINFSFFNVEWDYMISISMAIFIIFISLTGYLKPYIFDNRVTTSKKSKTIKYTNSSLSESYRQELKSHLLRLMKTNELYKDNSLSLSKLASHLNTSTHITSQVINECFNKGFHEFVNDYRINEAANLFDEKNFNQINDILFEVGYNNKVTFIKAFKKRKGMLPSEYRKHMKKSLQG